MKTIKILNFTFPMFKHFNNLIKEITRLNNNRQVLDNAWDLTDNTVLYNTIIKEFKN